MYNLSRWVIVSIAVTTLAAIAATLGSTFDLPSIVNWLFSIVAYPFLFLGAAVTYFAIVGDNYDASRDLWLYTVPISLCINSVFAFLLGSLWDRVKPKKS